MKYLLDTNVCADYFNSRFPSVAERIQRSSPDDLCLSSIVVAELRFGADRSQRSQENHARIDTLLEEIRCFAFDLAAAAVYGRVRGELEGAGQPIGPYDTLIAAHALSLGLVLVSDNVKEFSRVSGLRIENWRR
jgi:tRNA(fMet)-specific endonuclease VapC